MTDKQTAPPHDAGMQLATQRNLIALKCGPETAYIVDEAIKSLRSEKATSEYRRGLEDAASIYIQPKNPLAGVAWEAYREAATDYRDAIRAIKNAAPQGGLTERRELAEARKAQPSATERTCAWHLDGDESGPFDDGTYGTACGHYYHYGNGTLEECGARYCQGCGGKIDLAQPTERKPT